jgi:hypothetical protein
MSVDEKPQLHAAPVQAAGKAFDQAGRPMKKSQPGSATHKVFGMA